MIIKPLELKDRDIYNTYAQQYGTIFNTLSWTCLFNENSEHYGLYDKGGNLTGGFLTYKERKFGLSIYRNPPFTPEIGPFIKIDATNPVSVMDLWKKTQTLIADFLDNLRYSVISVSLNKNVIDMHPFIWKKFKVSPGYTYIVDLELSEESIWKRMSNERRKNITKGRKDGLNVRKSDDFGIIRALVLKTFSRQSKKLNQFYLDKILFEFSTSINSFAFVTYQNNQPIACSFCIYDAHTAYYILGGYDNEMKHHGAGAISMWEAIKYSKEIGIKYFDFEGSMNPQIEKYFRGFGGQLTPYFQINKALLPLEMLLKLKTRELF
jgi:lipid II:glycine glycyltransferase (peptidoglycan interpeptide bridge formation enzyme)